MTASFSLLGNPFAVLDATPAATLADLAACADRLGTPDAAAAARALSIPRSRLSAEIAFLPGLTAGHIAATLESLRRHARPSGVAELPEMAACNLLAHLCSAGLADDQDRVTLARCRPKNPDSLAAVLDTARGEAGMPRVQAAALLEELAALADLHAAALVDAVLATQDPAACLAALIEDAAPGAPPLLLRKAAAGWARRSGAELARLETAATGAVTAARQSPDPAALNAAATAIRTWAAHSRPQRLADARAALDHRPTLKTISGWRNAADRMANGDRLADGIALAALLADCFADLPGEARALREDVQTLRARGEEQALTPLLEQLRETVARLAADPRRLCAVLARRPFGPGLPRGDAAELWSRFDAACARTVVSESPWITVRTLVLKLAGGEADILSAQAAVSIQRGMAARAGTARLVPLAERIVAGVRALEGGVAVAEYRRVTRRRWLFWWAVPWRNRRIFRAIDRALALVDDPDSQHALERHRDNLRRGIRRRRVVWAGLALLAGAVAGINALDSDYARNAPYRHLPPRSLAARR